MLGKTTEKEDMSPALHGHLIFFFPPIIWFMDPLGEKLERDPV